MDGKNGELNGHKVNMDSKLPELLINDVRVEAKNLPVKEELGVWKVKVPIAPTGAIEGQTTKNDVNTTKQEYVESGEVKADIPSSIKIDKKAEARTHSDSMLGPEIPDVVDLRTDEEKVLGDAWEKSVEKQVPETGKDSIDRAAFEKAKTEWRETRDLANKLEADYAKEYEKHVLTTSKKLSSLPRRIFGLEPKLPPKLQELKDKADNARKDFNKSARDFLMSGGSAERFRRRLEPKVSATLPFVHQQRRDRQYKIVSEGWAENQNLRRALEALGKHKYKLTATAIGISALTTGGILPVLAAMGAGLIAAGATKEGLTSTYVQSARTRLKNAREASGENFLSKSYEEMNKEMENLTFLVGAREARTKTAATVAGVAAGLGAAGYAATIGAETVPLDAANSPTDVISKPEPVQEMGDANAPDQLTPEVPNKADLNGSSETKTSPDLLESLGKPQEDLVLKEAEEGPAKQPDVRIIPEAKVEPEIPLEQPTHREGVMEGHDGHEHNPEGDDIDEYEDDDGRYHEEEDTSASEAGPFIEHEVVRGDNAWNIMEGKGPDTNPVGGKSEVIKDMSLADRRYWLDKVFDYCDKNPEFAKEVGAVKSGGNIHLIHPGETINVSMLDEKIMELMKLEAGNDIAAINLEATGESEVQNMTSADESIAEQGSITVKSPRGEDVVINRVSDVNQMNLREAGYLYNAANASDPNALRFIEEMGMDKETFVIMYDSLGVRGEYDADMTIDEWMNPKEAPQAASVVLNDSAPRNELQPDIDQEGEFNSLPKDSNILREASLTPEAVNDNGEAVQNYVRSIENPKVGIFDRLFFNTNPNISGTWEALSPEQMTIGQFKELASSPNLETELANRGVSAEGFAKWGETLDAQTKLIPANDNDTLAEYLSSVTSGQRVA